MCIHHAHRSPTERGPHGLNTTHTHPCASARVCTKYRADLCAAYPYPCPLYRLSTSSSDGLGDVRTCTQGAYDAHNLRLVVADMFVDAKARHICSMQETRFDLLGLFMGALWPQARDGDIQIAFF